MMKRIGLGAAAAATCMLSFGAAEAREQPTTEIPVAGSLSGAATAVAGDINGDGLQDLVAGASGSPDQVLWYAGTPAGTFAPPVVIDSAFTGVEFVNVADVDGDGDLDVLGASLSLGDVTWWENSSGDGTTWVEVIVDGAYGDPWHVEGADIDGDGDIDITSVSDNNSDLTWWENTAGDGSAWTERTVDGNFSGSTYSSAADMDNDGDLDLVGAAYDGGEVAWFENTLGDGTAWTKTSIDLAFPLVWGLNTGDIDGDGDIDVVAGSTNADDMSWWANPLGTGSTTWVQTDLDLNFDNPRVPLVADIDLDGDMDVAATAASGDDLAWWENTNGVGTAWTKYVLDTNLDNADGTTVADLDGDGDLDFAAVAFNDNELNWYRNDSVHTSSRIEDVVTPVSDDGPWGTAHADIDGDGDLDAVVALFNDDEVGWSENTLGDGSTWAFTSIATGVSGAMHARPGDVDGDGDFDVVVTAQLGDDVLWFENTAGDGSAWSANTIDASLDGAWGARLTDIDQDGDLDVVAAGVNADDVVWYENTAGDGSAWTKTTIDAFHDGADYVEVGDIDGDGDTDVAVSARNADTVAWYANSGDGSAWVKTTVVSAYDSPRSVDLGDIDGDGDLDVVASAYSDDELRWFQNTIGDGSAWGPIQIATGRNGARGVAAEDFDGDGDLDVVLSTYLDDDVHWYENLNGIGGSWLSHLIDNNHDGPAYPSVADYDGDGSPDVMVGGLNADEVLLWSNERAHADLEATIAAPPTPSVAGTSVAVWELDLTHLGRPGDSDVELATLDVVFTNGAAAATAADVSSLFSNMDVVRDDGDGVYTAADAEAGTTGGAFTATGGLYTLALTDGDADAAVALGTPGTFFVVLDIDAAAGAAALSSLDVALTLTTSTVEDAAEDIGLDLRDPVDTAGATVAVDQAPTADAGPAISATEGTPFPVDGSASTDTDGTIQSWAWDCDGNGSFETVVTTATTTCPAVDDDATLTVSLQVTDSGGNVSAADTTTVTIANVAPTAGITGDAAGDEGATLSWTGSGTDPSTADTATLTWAWDVTDASGTSLSTATTATHSFALPDDGAYTVSLTVSDDDGGSDTATFAVTVANVAPTITSSPTTTLLEGTPWTYLPTVTDPGTETFVWSVALSPAAMTLDAGTGQLDWTPSLADAGVANPTLTVDDGDGGTDSQTLNLTIAFIDTEPDGLPDTWESANGLDPTVDDSGDDPDADGVTNLDEWLNGTDPNVFDGPDAPVPTAPIAGAEADSLLPVLSWTNATDPNGDPLTYDVEVYSDAGATVLVTSTTGVAGDGSGTSSWTLDMELLENTDYWWHVRADDGSVAGAWSTVESFFVNATEEAPSDPVAVSPLDGDRVAELSPVLTWSDSTDPDRDWVVYHVRVWDEAAENILAEVTDWMGIARDTSWTVDVALTDNTRYQWDVRAIDEHGTESGWSVAQAFQIDASNDVPTTPVWVSPDDGAALEDVSPTFEATGSTDLEGDAIDYEIDLDTVASYDSGAGYSAVVEDDGSGSVVWDLSDDGIELAENSDWYARVRAVDALGGASPWAELQIFVRGENDAPSAPVLVSPEDGFELDFEATIPELIIQPSEDPEGDVVTYEIAVATADGMADILANARDLEDADSISWEGPGVLEPGTYYWSARATDEFDARSDWAPPFAFTIAEEIITGGGGGGEQPGCDCESSVASADAGSLAAMLGLLAIVGLRRRRD